MGFSFSSQPLTSDTNESNTEMDKKKKPVNSSAPAADLKKPAINRQSNMMLQMDDFLALARDPVPAKKPVVEVKQPAPVVVEEKKADPELERHSTCSESLSMNDKEDEADDKNDAKKKRDRNAPLAPKKKTEDPKKAKKLEAIKLKKEQAEAEALKFVLTINNK